ncbi:MAG TPA: ArsR family transcriptional regulator [Candidatus Nanoarchaeia archaeon]|nr:ArsR family transcriptional regulator [Candidatus Nanoarchaeia archaeon]
MKNQSVRVLDLADEEFADTLIGLGLKRNVAKTLTYLKNVDEVTSREIERGSDLRQPEVSNAMRELKNMNWVIIREQKKPGKGRPFKIYRLDEKINSIIKQLEQRKTLESKRMMDNIQQLKLMKLGN